MPQFPTKNKFSAKEITQLNFDIYPHREDLYVDLDEVRQELWDIEHIYFLLNIDKGQLTKTDFTSYNKILYSGHAGCGKSLELRKLHGDLNDPSRYFAIFINLEEETDLSKFQSEDFFVLLIMKLVEQLKAQDIDSEVPSFSKIAKEWVSDQSIKEDLKETYKLELESEAGLGGSFLSFLTLKSGLKALFASESETIKEIRRKIKTNPAYLIKEFNKGLEEVRAKLLQAGRGNDIMFIVDGSEKIRYEVYEDIFIHGRQSIRDLEVNVICSVPIHSFYHIQNSVAQDTFESMILPMVKIDEKSIPVFRKIMTKRLDEKTFFEKKVLNYCIEQSGGCPRQLIKIVNRALIKNIGRKITMDIAKEIVHDLGRMMRDLLEEKHLEILQGGDFDNANIETLELLFSLALLKYNGDRVINPILKPFI